MDHLQGQVELSATLEYKNSDRTVGETLDLDMQIFNAIKKYRLQSLGNSAVLAIVDRLNLEPFLDFFKNFNHAKDLPYHNEYHCLCVMLNAYEGSYYAKLTDEEVRGLCAGAMFHDFNHSGGKLQDHQNIKIAQEGLKIAQSYAKSKLLGLSEVEFQIASSVISVTEYPFAKAPSTMMEHIIRDADLMQPYEESARALIKQYQGLKVEIEVQRNRTYSMVEFATGVKNFQHDETIWHTEWGYEKSQARNWEMAKTNLFNLLMKS